MKSNAWINFRKKLVYSDITFLFSESFNVRNQMTPFAVVSFSELGFKKIIDQYGSKSLLEHHNRFFSRVYPMRTIIAYNSD